MGWFSGNVIATPGAGATLVERTFPNGAPHMRVILAVRTDMPFEGMLRLLDDRQNVLQEAFLPITERLWVSPPLGPFNVPVNGRLRLVSRAAVSTGEVRVALFHDA